MTNTLEQLKTIDAFLESVTEGLPIAVGSVCRLPFQAMIHWGLKLTRSDYELIKRLSAESYEEEWRTGGSALNNLINKATERARLGASNLELNIHLADIAVQVIAEMLSFHPNKPVKILDLGAGDAATTEALILRLVEVAGEDALKRCAFRLLEPSPPSVVKAYGKITALERSYGRLDIKPYGEDDCFLRDVRDEIYDMVISNAALHHKSFPDHWNEISRVVKNEGAVVVGDWYTAIWYHPALFVPVLEVVHADRDKVDEFKRFFDITDESALRIMSALPDHEQKIQTFMLEYIRCLAELIVSWNSDSKQGAESRGLPVPRAIRFLCIEAHELEADRLAKMREAGLETDLHALRETRPAFRRLKENKRSCMSAAPGFAMIHAVGKAIR